MIESAHTAIYEEGNEVTDTIAQGGLAQRAAEAWANAQAESAAEQAARDAATAEHLIACATATAEAFSPGGDVIATRRSDPNEVYVTIDGAPFVYDHHQRRLTATAKCSECGTATVRVTLRDLAHYGRVLAGDEQHTCTLCTPPEPVDVGWRARYAKSVTELQTVLNEIASEGGEPWVVQGDNRDGFTVIARAAMPPAEPVEPW